MVKPVIKWEQYQSPFKRRKRRNADDEMLSVMTPNGPMPIDVEAFNLNAWYGHTNFDISTNVAMVISNCAGVEFLYVSSRYKMKVGIAKLFDESDVLHDIDNQVYEYLDVRKKLQQYTTDSRTRPALL